MFEVAEEKDEKRSANQRWRIARCTTPPICSNQLNEFDLRDRCSFGIGGSRLAQHSDSNGARRPVRPEDVRSEDVVVDHSTEDN